MAGIIDNKAKPSPPAELIIGLTLVSHGPMSLDSLYGQDWMLQDFQINFPGSALQQLICALQQLICALQQLI